MGLLIVEVCSRLLQLDRFLSWRIAESKTCFLGLFPGLETRRIQHMLPFPIVEWQRDSRCCIDVMSSCSEIHRLECSKLFYLLVTMAVAAVQHMLHIQLFSESQPVRSALSVYV